MIVAEFSFGEQCRAKILAKHDQEIEEALAMTRGQNEMRADSVFLAEYYKQQEDPFVRYIGLLMSIGYNTCAESWYQRNKPEESSDG